MTAAPRVSLVVAVYRRPDFLERIFVALEGQSFADFEVAIADDGSGPEIADLVARWQGRFREPIVHAWQEDRGFRKTIVVNRAVALSRGATLVFLDGDCVPHHRFLERHVGRTRPGQALSGRRVMLDEEITRRLTLDDIRSRRLERPSFWWRHAAPRERRNGLFAPWLYGWRGGFNDRYEILGCNFSLSRQDFLRVNGYDERIVRRGMEDTNLKTRLVNAGVAVRCLAQEAIVYHCDHGKAEADHDREAVERWGGTHETWTPFGVVKGEPPAA